MSDRKDITCRSCGCTIQDHTPYWRCPPLGAVCDACWPDQSRGYLREYRVPMPLDDKPEGGCFGGFPP